MPVYVDDSSIPYDRMKMSHMIANTDHELHLMADAIGLNRNHWQSPPQHESHYDVSLRMRDKAIAAGAVPVTMRQLAAMIVRRRVVGQLGDPEDALLWMRDFFNKRREELNRVRLAERQEQQ